jgi:DNA-3-methyladenine glycosylase II
MHLFRYGSAEIDHLKHRDRKLGRAIDHIGMIERQVMPYLFRALVHSVVAQQIFWKAADTVWRRLCGSLLDITPRNVDGLVKNRDRGRPHSLRPLTPPGIRNRTRRFI